MEVSEYGSLPWWVVILCTYFAVSPSLCTYLVSYFAGSFFCDLTSLMGLRRVVAFTIWSVFYLLLWWNGNFQVPYIADWPWWILWFFSQCSFMSRNGPFFQIRLSWNLDLSFPTGMFLSKLLDFLKLTCLHFKVEKTKNHLRFILESSTLNG